MSTKEKNQKADPKPQTEPEQKTSETVHLSAEELRKISGGQTSMIPPPKP